MSTKKIAKKPLKESSYVLKRLEFELNNARFQLKEQAKSAKVAIDDFGGHDLLLYGIWVGEALRNIQTLRSRILELEWVIRIIKGDPI